jgi:hypothetical protein
LLNLKRALAVSATLSTLGLSQAAISPVTNAQVTPAGSQPAQHIGGAGHPQAAPDQATYPGAYGWSPEPSFQENSTCHKVEGTWTEDQGVVNRIEQARAQGVPAAEATVNTHWTSGLGGPGGRSTAPLEVYLNPDGTGVFVGREIFEGFIDGHRGSMTNWNVGTFDASLRYTGRVYSIGGTDELRNVHFEAGFVGTFFKGGHWTQPSRLCFDPVSPGGAQAPSPQYPGTYGPSVEPPFAVNSTCHKVDGTWTEDQGVVNKINQAKAGGFPDAEATVNTHWTSGLGAPGGRSSAPLEVYLNPDGTGVFVGREIFEGSIDGHRGSMINWNVGTFDASLRYTGRVYSIGGTDDLKDVHFEAGFVGTFFKGGHWTQPSKLCFS